MSNKTQLQANNTNLDTLITRVNDAKDTAASLPDAGGSGGGVETCTVNMAGDGEGMVNYTSFINGQIDVVCEAFYNGVALNNVVCGSACTFMNDKTILQHSVSSGEVKYRSSAYLCYKTPISGNTSAIVTIYND